MKVYTKTGDKGTTELIGGKRVPKDNARIEVYGAVDELISYVGLLRDQNIREELQQDLISIQDRLMTIASILATDCENCNYKIPALKEADITFLETRIDTFDKELPPLNAFVLPGGHQIVSFCHITRSICRRVERMTITLNREHTVPDHVIKYLNRLSDYLFVLSRLLTKDLQAVEIPWKPEL